MWWMSLTQRERKANTHTGRVGGQGGFREWQRVVLEGGFKTSHHCPLGWVVGWQAGGLVWLVGSNRSGARRWRGPWGRRSGPWCAAAWSCAGRRWGWAPWAARSAAPSRCPPWRSRRSRWRTRTSSPTRWSPGSVTEGEREREGEGGREREREGDGDGECFTQEHLLHSGLKRWIIRTQTQDTMRGSSTQWILPGCPSIPKHAVSYAKE